MVPAELAGTTASVAEDESSSIVASSIVAGDAQEDGAALLAQEPAGPSVEAGGEDGGEQARAASHSDSVSQAEAQAVAPVAAPIAAPVEASGSGGGGPKVYATPPICKELEPHHPFTIHLDVSGRRWQA